MTYFQLGVPSSNDGIKHQTFKVLRGQHHNVQVLCKLKKIGNHWSRETSCRTNSGTDSLNYKEKTNNKTH
jgi:hypothetical protein